MFAEIEILGNLGRDPEMRYTNSGQPVTSFSVATNRSYNNPAGEKVTETTWWRVSTWGKQAEVCSQYLHKGSKVFIKGRPNVDAETGGPRLYQKQDGSWGASFELTASLVKFLSQNGEVEREAAGDPNAGETADIPF